MNQEIHIFTRPLNAVCSLPVSEPDQTDFVGLYGSVREHEKLFLSRGARACCFLQHFLTISGDLERQQPRVTLVNGKLVRHLYEKVIVIVPVVSIVEAGARILKG